MAFYSIDVYPGDGATKTFALTFEFISRDSVFVYSVDDTTKAETALTVVTSGNPSSGQYKWDSDKQITLGDALPTGTSVKIQRDTTIDLQIVQWKDGSYIIAEDLNTSDKQWLYNLQELEDHIDQLNGSSSGPAVKKITGTAPVEVDSTNAQEPDISVDETVSTDNPNALTSDTRLMSEKAIDGAFSQAVGASGVYPPAGVAGKVGKLRVDNTGAEPRQFYWNGTAWVQIPTKGDKGDQGIQGPAGPPPGIQSPSATATNVPLQSNNVLGQAYASVSADSSGDLKFNFGIPVGQKGDKGDVGDGVNYLGEIDATTAPQPEDSKNGDFYVNTTAGTSSWTGLSTVGVNERLIYNGHTDEWDSYASTDLWQEAGDQLYPRNANADVLVGGTLPSAPNISLNASGSASFEGPVGIGTDAPNSKLHVEGSGDATSTNVVYSEYTANIQTDTAFLNIGSVNGIPCLQGSGTGTAYHLLLNPFNGNVGIGTDSPTSPLTVDAGNISKAVEVISATPNARIKLSDGDATTGAFVTGIGNALKFETGGSNSRMFIDSTGNVGIGTDSPVSKLNVIGEDQTTTALDTAKLSANITGDGYSPGSGGSLGFSAGKVQKATFAAIKGLLVSGNDNSAGDLAFSLRRVQTDATLTEAMRITRAGNVGIGTDAPVTPLHIIGNTRGQSENDATVEFTLRGIKADGGTVSDYKLRHTGSEDTFQLLRNDSDLVTVKNNGKVGIGTDEPNQTLTLNNGSKPQLGLQVGKVEALRIQATSAACYIDSINKDLIYRTGNASTNNDEAMRLDSSGRLLVGTTGGGVMYGGDTNNALQVRAGTKSKIVVHRQTNDINGAYLRLAKSRVNDTQVINNDEIGRIEFIGSDGTDLASRQAQISCHSDGNASENNTPGRLEFRTTAAGASIPTERMSISSEGYIFPDQTSRAKTADISATSNKGIRVLAGGAQTAVRYEGFTDLAGTQYHMAFSNSNGIVGYIATTGTATAYNTSSDYRLKENVAPMTGAADRVKALKPCRFNFKTDATKTVDGFLAHEAQEVVPESVTGTKDAMEDIGTLLDWDGTVREENVTEPTELTYSEEVVDDPGQQGKEAVYSEPVLIQEYQPAVYGEPELISPATEPVIGPMGRVIEEGKEAVYGDPVLITPEVPEQWSEPELISPAVEEREPTYKTVTRQMSWTKTRDRDVMQGIDQSKLVPLLTAALQEALGRIEALEAAIAGS